MASTARGSPSSSSLASSSGSDGTPSWRAKSLPRPAGTMPNTGPGRASAPPPFPASAPPSVPDSMPARAPPTQPTMPSPPTPSTTRPVSAAARATPVAWSRPRLYSTATSAPASRSSRASVISDEAEAESPAAGLTIAVNERGPRSEAGMCSLLCGRRDEDARVEDPGRVDPLLDGAEHRDAQRPDLPGVPVAMVGAHAVMMTDRPARVDDRVVDGPLGPVPVRHRVVLALRGHDGEVEGRPRRVHVRDVAHHQRRRARPGQRADQRRPDGLVQPRDVPPERGRLQRLHEGADVQQRVAQVGGVEPAALPLLAGLGAERLAARRAQRLRRRGPPVGDLPGGALEPEH